MGRRYPYLWRQHSYIRLEESGDSGCIWGLLRLLNYHQHWQKVKRILPYKKHGSKTRLRNSRDVGKQKGSSRLNEEERAVDEANPIPVERANPPDTGSVSKRSIKVRIRELMMAKEKNSSYLPEQSIVETPNDGGKVDSSSEHKSAADADILEIFKVNKQIFLKMLNDHDLTRVKQPIKPGYWHSNGRLTKSGSFPCVNSTHMRDRGPSKLEDKQREIWPLAKSMPLLHENATSKGKLKSMRRASSLNESMDRYPQLFGSTSTFNKDIKRHLSRSLKLVINENDEPTPKFRRRLSLPESDYESFLPNLEAVNNSGPDSVEDSAVMNQAINEEICDFNQGDKVNEVAIDCDAQENQDLIPECPYKEEQMSTIELAVSEDYKTSLLSQKADAPEAHKTDEILPFKLVDEKRNYVNLVLELSGFIAKEQAWVWYTMEQPVNPAIFEQVEKQHYPLEQQKWGRKIIFDLINEALVEIDERSYLYYPRALSSSCHVHPIPKGGRLLEEVWVFVGRSLSWRPELDPTLDLAVAQDLLGRNGWMNLQIESECVALELEEIILDQLLLDELLLACSSKSLQHSFIL